MSPRWPCAWREAKNVKLVLNCGECHVQEEAEPEPRAAKFINSKIKCSGPCKTSHIEQHKVAGKRQPQPSLGNSTYNSYQALKKIGQVWKEVFNYEACLDKESFSRSFFCDSLIWFRGSSIVNFYTEDTVSDTWRKHLSTKTDYWHLSRAENHP